MIHEIIGYVATCDNCGRMAKALDKDMLPYRWKKQMIESESKFEDRCERCVIYEDLKLDNELYTSPCS